MLETEAAGDAVDIRQADIFQWAAENEPLPFGVIVTADCDIANDKFGNYLTYVPIIRLRNYLTQYYLRDQVHRQTERVDGAIADLIRKMQREGRPDLKRPLSDEAIVDWIDNEPVEAVHTRLNSTDPRSQERLSKLIELRNSLLAARDEAATDAAMVQVIAVARRAKLQTIHKEIHDHIARLPGDKMYLSTVDDGNDESGFVILIRQLREIRISDIATRPIDLPHARARRVARLRSPYRYRLTQQLADTFAAIGLPTEYEAARSAALTSAYALES